MNNNNNEHFVLLYSVCIQTRKCRKTCCSFVLALPLLQVVKEERLVHRGAIQQPVRQSDGAGGRPEGKNVSSKDHFAGKYHTFIRGGKEWRGAAVLTQQIFYRGTLCLLVIFIFYSKSHTSSDSAPCD